MSLSRAAGRLVPAAVCVIRGLNLEPGDIATTVAAVSAKVTADVPARTFVSYLGEVVSNDTGVGGPWEKWPAGTGPELAFQRVPADARDTTSDVDYADNQGDVRITTPANPSDVAAQGATAKAKVGDTVSVKVGLSNRAPGTSTASPTARPPTRRTRTTPRSS